MNKRHIPGTSPDWHRELPDEDTNSLVDKYGNNYDNGYNFDEKVDNNPEETSFESLAKDRELADYIKNEVIYTGLFIDPNEIYSKFPPILYHKIRDPHITVAYRPDSSRVFLDSLDSEAKIRVIGYGNDGKNEGLLAEVLSGDPAIQKAVKENILADENNKHQEGPLPVHITLSLDEGASAYGTRKLNFRPLKTPVELTGNYKLFRNDGALISNKETAQEMKENNFHAEETVDPDWL